MHQINEHNITDAVVERLQACPDPRLQEILTSLVRHLHAFVKETHLSEGEWLQGIEFLTATGHMTTDKRQEFILLSDTLGVSMLAVAQNHAQPPGTTEATVFGPFHVEHAPEFAQGADIANGAPGEPLFVDATVRGPGGEAVRGAIVDVWQADEDGYYDVQYDSLAQHRARGVLETDGAGALRFRTILPVAYPVPTDGPVGQMLVASGRHPWRPAHVHFRIQAPGYHTLITHVFRAGDPYLDSDVVFGVRESLVAEYVAHAPGSGPHGREVEGRYHTLAFDFVLAREGAPSPGAS
ncbi:MAG: intradiol ring-cleavage dioxygenase [Rhizobacter sp.]|nr:intradiol ring-cleavage dioxygenase [Rhizobacter sp.]